ncbi:MAG: hypothetical protein U5R30_10370 [Deltaproteobacteria bacterium]|nr:hypothetical protein [Deltaproteobacteria bacterium]
MKPRVSSYWMILTALPNTARRWSSTAPGQAKVEEVVTWRYARAAGRLLGEPLYPR